MPCVTSTKAKIISVSGLLLFTVTCWYSTDGTLYGNGGQGRPSVHIHNYREYFRDWQKSEIISELRIILFVLIFRFSSNTN